MLGIGPGELVILLVIALLVLGPGRMPDVATGLGKAIREFRKVANDINSQLELDESVSKPLNELRSALNDLPVPAPRVKPPEVAPLAAGKAAAEDPGDEPVPVPLPPAVLAAVPALAASQPAPAAAVPASGSAPVEVATSVEPAVAVAPAAAPLVAAKADA